jgi:hypothetical protein
MSDYQKIDSDVHVFNVSKNGDCDPKLALCVLPVNEYRHWQLECLSNSVHKNLGFGISSC